MKILPIKTPLITQGDDIVSIFLETLDKLDITLQSGDIVAIADKIIAISGGRYTDYNAIHPSCKAALLAKTYDLEPGFVELVLRNADEILGGVSRALLTIKHDMLIANSGIDHKNAPGNSATLWPINPNETASDFRKQLEKKTGKQIGVLLVDSHVIPMRMGTLGLAIGLAGFDPVKDCRGVNDLYDHPLQITRINIADDLASAAHFVMGETVEQIPIAIIRDSNINIHDAYNPREVIISRSECLYMKNLTRCYNKS
jgi:coenzyme F420-0:L-glutamate ligase/coenzyme F420-1:gamma-L-glutamate ligase